MGNFFGSLYCIFEDFFGLELANYLWGISSPMSMTNTFIGIGWLMLGISLGIVLIYYYAVDGPRLNNIWGWGIFFVINAVLNFILGWQYVLSDYYDGKMVTLDPATDMLTPLNIGTSELIYFGMSNMFLSMVAFVIFSYSFRWWSRNCSHAPI